MPIPPRLAAIAAFGLSIGLIAAPGCGPGTTLGLDIIDSDNAANGTGGSLEANSNGYCQAVDDWDPAWVAFEDEVLRLVNEHRAAGADCGIAGTFEPSEPLAGNDALRCAARNHSLDMSARDYFSHTSPDGVDPGQRLNQAGYQASAWAENIAAGYPHPASVVEGWMSSPGHCANIMNPNLTETGVGYYDGSLWTQIFGRP